MPKQSGMSMIEVMVALLLSSFLILGITQVYLDNRENNLFQQSQGNNIENARFSILILEQELSKTGYRRQPSHTLEHAFPQITDTNCGLMTKGQIVKRISDTSFCIRYQPAFTGAKTCDGNDITGIPSTPYSDAEPVVEIFTLKDLDTTDGVNTPQLTCNNQVIASNISAIRFEYGVNSNEEKIVDKYTSSPTNTENVRAVQFSVLSASSTEVTKEASSTVYKHWFGNEPTDKKLYTMFSNSASMRNVMP
ncbi:PilW family protein [Pseudomonas sp. Gutcm_11s]|uniref:PilW family protein n=1 Tax=Pseudomonas sp. Gutcm_11s TaxID=3026088 RepID=UPI00235FB81D|nr:PilW family protein [Pseudomonas sp. Gutcm_11s]MDD0844522.1 PilW family protein [Pseudomonas sp. Gutcm_11s]